MTNDGDRMKADYIYIYIYEPTTLKSFISCYFGNREWLDAFSTSFIH